MKIAPHENHPRVVREGWLNKVLPTYLRLLSANCGQIYHNESWYQLWWRFTKRFISCEYFMS